MATTMRHTLFILLLVNFFVISLVHASVYKWVDEKGNIVYSQQPPEEQGKEFKRIKGLPKNKGQTNSAPAAQGQANQDGGQPARDKNNPVKETSSKAQETRRENCAKARKNLELYTTYRRFPDAQGNMTRMDDVERQKKIKESEQLIQDFCD